MRKAIPIVAAVLVFLAAVALIQPEPSMPVLTAAVDLYAGHTIASGDVVLQEVPERLAPEDAFSSIDDVIGKTLGVDRAAGDVIRLSNLGEPVSLQANERALAVRVTDSAGMAGLIRPGDIIGVVASINVQGGELTGGTFSKATIEGLRVLYLSPEFESMDKGAEPEVDPVTGLSQTEKREQEGTVVLAVPTGAQVVLYDFSGREAPIQSRLVNAIELLTALDSCAEASLSLYLLPSDAETFITSGLYLPDLVITPGPTPTNTPTPEGFELTPTVIPITPTPEAGS